VATAGLKSLLYCAIVAALAMIMTQKADFTVDRRGGNPAVIVR
jgi:hypothetical protein